MKFGDFKATAHGERIIAIRMAPRKALCARASIKEIEALWVSRNAVPMELRAPNGRVVPTEDIEITDLEWLTTLSPVRPEEDDWEEDSKLAELELMEEGARPAFRDELEDLLPPEWLEDGEESFVDDGEIEAADADDSDAPPEFPRYQIQVRIRGGG